MKASSSISAPNRTVRHAPTKSASCVATAPPISGAKPCGGISRNHLFSALRAMGPEASPRSFWPRLTWRANMDREPQQKRRPRRICCGGQCDRELLLRDVEARDAQLLIALALDVVAGGQLVGVALLGPVSSGRRGRTRRRLR